MWPGVVRVITLLASVKPMLPSPDVTATSHAEGGPLSIISPGETAVDGVSFISSCQKPVLPLRCMNQEEGAASGVVGPTGEWYPK